MSPSLPQQVLRKIPKVDEILSRPEIADLLKVHPRAVVLEAIRKGLEPVPRRPPPKGRSLLCGRLPLLL